jgi:hypothetical protein
MEGGANFVVKVMLEAEAVARLMAFGTWRAIWRWKAAGVLSPCSSSTWAASALLARCGGAPFRFVLRIKERVEPPPPTGPKILMNGALLAELQTDGQRFIRFGPEDNIYLSGVGNEIDPVNDPEAFQHHRQPGAAIDLAGKDQIPISVAELDCIGRDVQFVFRLGHAVSVPHRGAYGKALRRDGFGRGGAAAPRATSAAGRARPPNLRPARIELCGYARRPT